MPTDPLIQTPPVSNTSNSAIDMMIGQVAGLIGGDDDPDARQVAISFLDRAVDELNMNGIVLFQRREVTFTPADGATTLALPSDWGWPDDRGFVYDASTRLINIIEWRPWEQFRGLISKTGDTNFSVPAFMSIKTEVNEALIYVYPYISSNKVSSIIIPYFARVSRLSEVSTLTISNEIREGLIRYAEYFVMRYRYKDKPAIWTPFKADAAETMRRAIIAARRSEVGWHLNVDLCESGRVGSPNISTPFGVTYLVISGS